MPHWQGLTLASSGLSWMTQPGLPLPALSLDSWWKPQLGALSSVVAGQVHLDAKHGDSRPDQLHPWK